VIERKIIGNPWSELPITNEQATSPKLARMQPIVIATNDSGSEILYCGGRLVGRSNDRWIHLHDGTEDIASSAAALFPVESASWESVPPMPQP